MEELRTEFDEFIKEWQQKGYSYDTLYAWMRQRILHYESSRVELPVGVPSRTNSETLLECNMENKYSIEPHGDGYAIYYGRCMHRHGYNLAHLTECEEKFIKIIEEALNEKSVKPWGEVRPTYLQLCGCE